MLGHRRGLSRGQTFPNAPRPRFVRKAERVDVDAKVFLRRSGKLNCPVRAYDVTRFGCRLEFIERPSLDERVWIKFDGLGAVEGLVCWINGFVVGVEFVSAMHPAVFDMLVSRLR